MNVPCPILVYYYYFFGRALTSQSHILNSFGIIVVGTLQIEIKDIWYYFQNLVLCITTSRQQFKCVVFQITREQIWVLCLEIQFLLKDLGKDWYWKKLASSNYSKYQKNFLTQHQRQNLTMKKILLLLRNVGNIFKIQRLQDPNKGLVHLYNFFEISNKQRFNG